MQDIHGIRPPVSVGFDPTLLKTILIVSGVALLLILLFFLIKKFWKKKPASGLMARSLPLASGLIQAISSPMQEISQPCFCNSGGGINIAKLVLPQALGKAAVT